MNTEKMVDAKRDYDEWYNRACRLALKLGKGTTVTPNGLRFTYGRPPQEER